MNNQDWTKDIPEKLDSYTEVNLDGLWDSIESNLGGVAPKEDDNVIPMAAVAARRPVFRKVAGYAAAISAVAAAAVILIGLGSKGGSTLVPDDNLAKVEPVEVTPTVPSSSSEVPQENAVEVKDITPSRNRVASSVEKKETTGEMPDNTIVENNQYQVVKDDNTPMVNNPSDNTPSKDSDNQTTRPTRRPSSLGVKDFEDARLFTEENTPKSFRNRLALSAVGGSSYSGSLLPLAADYLVDDMTPYYADATLLSYSPENAALTKIPSLRKASSLDWEISASVGVWAELYLTERTSVSSGLMYTRLTAEENSWFGKYSAGYLGVPVRLSYDLVQKDHFMASVSVGAKMDYLISPPQDIDIKSWQSSAYMGVQADYMITRLIGLRFSLGGDFYLPLGDTSRSPFNGISSVTNASAGLLLRL